MWFVLSLLTACTAGGADTGAASIEIVHPSADDSIAVGPFSVTVLVENFSLQAPATTGKVAPAGYISASLNGTEVLTTAETTFSVSTDTMGTYTLAVELRTADGGALTPPATDEVTLAIE